MPIQRKPSNPPRLVAAAILVLAIGLGAMPRKAHAVFLEADAIEADGAVSTIDIWFFSFDAAATALIQVNDLDGVDGADPDMVIHVDDGTFSNVFAVDNTAGVDPAISMLFPAGSYFAIVANNPLAVGELGPTQPDAALALSGYDYEFNGPTPVGGDITINCVLSGNLDGGFSKRVLNADTCRRPPTAAPEPATLGLFGFGVLALGLAIAWRRRTVSS